MSTKAKRTASVISRQPPDVNQQPDPVLIVNGGRVLAAF
jgi:hypothetical protein